MFGLSFHCHRASGRLVPGRSDAEMYRGSAGDMTEILTNLEIAWSFAGRQQRQSGLSGP